MRQGRKDGPRSEAGSEACMTERERRFYVFRVNYDQHKSFIEEELKAGRLRQGWGPVPLRKADDEGYNPKAFVEGYRSTWPEDSEEEAAKRYGILFPMLEMQPGDLVIIPKIPDWDCFTLAEVSGTYRFDVETPLQKAGVKDFGHVIPINPATLKVFRHNSSIPARTVSWSFRAYQKAINNIWSTGVQEAILALWEATPTSQVTELDGQVHEEILEGLKNRLAHLKPGEVEQLVARAFARAGYVLDGRHRYDRKGGDADLLLTFRLPLLSELTPASVKLVVQVKNKQGVDKQASQGIEQLVAIAPEPSVMKVLVSTADSFSDEDYKLASEKGVYLLVGRNALALIARGIIG